MSFSLQLRLPACAQRTAAIAAARGGAARSSSRSCRSWAGRRPRSSTPSTASTRPGERPRKVVGGIADEVVGRAARARARSSSARTPTAPAPASPTSPSTSRSSGSGWSTRRRRARAAARLRPGRDGPRRPGRRRAWSRPRPACGRVDARGRHRRVGRRRRLRIRRVRVRAGRRARAGADPDDDVPDGQRRPRARAGRSPRTSSTRLMAEAAAERLRPAPPRGQRPHHAGRRASTATIMTRLDPSGAHADGGRVVNATDPVVPDRGRDRRAAPGARVRPVPRRPRARATSGASLVALGTQIGVRETRRVYGDYRLTREDVLGGAAVRRRRSACAARRSRTTTPAPTRAGEYLPGRRGGRHPATRTLRRPRRGERAGRRPLLLGHPRRPRLGPLDGAVHGDGPGRRHRGRPRDLGGCDPRGGRSTRSATASASTAPCCACRTRRR